MAKDNKEQDLMGDKKVKEILDIVNKSNKLTTSLTYGVNQDFLNDNKDTLRKVDNSVKSVLDRYKQGTGENVVEFFTKLLYEEDKQNGKKKYNNGKININKMLEENDTGLISEIFMSDRTRFDLYRDYEAIIEYIPQLSAAIDIYTDNIISPDDFTKDIFNIFYDNVKVGSDSTDKIIKNLRELSEKYPKLEKKCSEYIKKALYLGDYFIAVLSLKDEFGKFLTPESIKTESSFVKLDESTLLISEDEISEAIELFKPQPSEKDKKEKETTPSKTKDELKKSILESLNTNVEFVSAISTINETYTHMNEDFTGDIDKIKKSAEKIIDSSGKISGANGDVDDLTNLNINGSFIKELHPKNVVKLQFGDTCFGYYFIEKLDEVAPLSGTQNPNVISLRQTADLPSSNEEVDARTRLITNIFTKNLSKKLNKKYLEQNQEFKTMIYELVKNKYITEKKIRITYFSPNEVFHLCPKEMEDGYGESILKKILFTAKIYLAVLTTQLMMKISRSADHRTFYIDTGLSKDVEGLVMGFVRDIKSKEIKIGDLKSVDNIFNVIGSFHDYFIPQSNGERSVDIDTVPGMNVEMENDFLEYLRKTMISGIGVPPTLLSYDQDVEFSRSVSSMNGKFVRSVISYQKPLGLTFTGIYRSLYKNEYELTKTEESKDKKEDTEVVVDLSKISVKFPSPANLMMTNMIEQISSARDIIEFLVTTMVGTEASPKIKDEVTKNITKNILPNFNWEMYEKIMEKVKMSLQKESLSGDETPEDL